MVGLWGAQVQEAAAAAEGWLRLPDAALNMASVCLAQGQAAAAIQQYASALRRCNPPAGSARHCYGAGLGTLLISHAGAVSFLVVGAAQLGVLISVLKSKMRKVLCMFCVCCQVLARHGRARAAVPGARVLRRRAAQGGAAHAAGRDAPVPQRPHAALQHRAQHAGALRARARWQYGHVCLHAAA